MSNKSPQVTPETATTADKRSPLEIVEERRAKRKRELAAERDLQRAIDLEAVDELEIAHGDSNVAVVSVPFVKGCVSLVAVRVPTPPEIKRYRARVTKKPNSKVEPDPLAAAEELGECCVVYPGATEYESLLAIRPAIKAQAGAAALNLALGKEESEGKD